MENILSTIYFAFNAVTPILLLVLLGYFLKCHHYVSEEFLTVANRFNFRFALSCLLFKNVYALDSFENIPLNMAIFTVVSLFVLTIVGFIVAHFTTNVRARKGILIQAAFRSNFAIIGLAIADSLAGERASALASAMQAPSIIYFNLAAVLCMSIYADDGHTFSLKKVVKGVVTNPLIIGLALGIVSLAVRQSLPVDAQGQPVFTIAGNLPWLYSCIDSLGRMATPFALVVLGGQFSFSAVKGMKKELAAGIVLRLIGAPVIGFMLAFAARAADLITLDSAAVAVLIALFGSPAAINSVVMAAEMHADDKLAGQLVVWTSILNLGSVFVQIVLFRMAGIL